MPRLALPLFLLASVAVAGPARVRVALRSLDPVALVRGEEVSGLESIAESRGLYRYYFANESNRDEFRNHGDRYTIQMGGACARMGPLSGLGAPDRFAVHEGRIYIFASDRCRDGFLSAPNRHVDGDDEPPQGSEQERARGKELVELAVKGMGGAERLDAVRSLRVEHKIEYEGAGDVGAARRTVSIAFPDRFRDETVWVGQTYADATGPDGGFRVSGPEWWAMEDAVRRYLVREFHRRPVVILKAHGHGAFRAVAKGPARIDATDVELVEVAFLGATSTLAVDPATGRILEIRYRGRPSSGAIGDIVKRFSDFRDVGGLTLPFGVSGSFEGKPVEGRKTTCESMAVDADLDPALFRPPG